MFKKIDKIKSMKEKIDFLAIGDIVTDAFIRLKDASLNCELDNDNCKLCVRYGDKVPFESVDVVRAVGNSPNAAVSASRLGLSSYLVAHVGDDEEGGRCVGTLKENNVHTDFVYVNPGLKTNYHYVLWYDVDRTILVNHTEFPYSLPKEIEENPPKWIYLSSLGGNSLPYHMEIAEYLKRHPEVKLAFQPGTFQIKLGIEKLKNIYEHSDVFFCNVEEAEKILNMNPDKGSREENVLELMKEFIKLGPKIICITDGINGAYAYDGKDAWFQPVYPHDPFERTGAGDAFASTFTSALALENPLDVALSWGPVNSMSVVQYVGAQKGLLSRDELEKYLKESPSDYKIKKIN